MPCKVRIFTSSASEWPRRAAFSRAMSAEIATSPATRLTLLGSPVGDGNDSTSVGLSFPRNRLLRDRISRLFVTNTFTGSCRRAARLARNTKRSSVDRLSPAILLRRITNLLPAHLVTKSPQNKQEGPGSALLTPATLFSRGFSGSLVRVRSLGAFHFRALSA